eukprot:6030585-Alexandrium_andersonii.AAC.1
MDYTIANSLALCLVTRIAVAPHAGFDVHLPLDIEMAHRPLEDVSVMPTADPCTKPEGVDSVEWKRALDDTAETAFRTVQGYLDECSAWRGMAAYWAARSATTQEVFEAAIAS